MSEPTKGNRVTTEVATRRDIPLNWDVFVTPGIPVVISDLPPGTKQEWISALDTIESLNPRAVIAGHKRPGNDDSPKIIDESRQLHPRFDRVAGTTTTVRELYDKMLELYPDRAGQSGASAVASGPRGQTVIHMTKKGELICVQ
jgi:hypothetical protein